MSKAHCCDQCGKLIKDSDIRITLDGFYVLQNRENNDSHISRCCNGKAKTAGGLSWRYA